MNAEQERLLFSSAFTLRSLCASAVKEDLAGLFPSRSLPAPNSVGRDLTVIDEPGTRHWAMFSFINDKWQVSKKLTL